MNLNKLFGTKEGEPEKSEQTTKEDVSEIKKEEPTIEASAEETPEETDKEIEKDPYEGWTREQIIAEMKARGSEAAKNRIEKKEVQKHLEEEYEKKLTELEKKFSPFIEKAQEYEKMKEKEADKKRSLEEKLADRETKAAELRQEKEMLEAQFQEEKRELQRKAEKLSADLEAYEGYWKSQLDKELGEVPQKHKNLAEMIVKGAGDVKSALDALREAKAENVFGVKKVSVFHATPTAKEGARLDAAKAQESAKDNLSKNQKLKAGLANWKDKQKRRLID